MKIGFRFGVVLLVIALLAACKTKHSKAPRNAADTIHNLNLALMEAVVQDGFSPPVASRVYAYPNIAAYEAAIYLDSGLISYRGQLRNLEELPQPVSEEKYAWEVVMVQSFCDVARSLVYRDHIIDEEQKKLFNLLKPQLDENTWNNSVDFGKQLGGEIIKWANTDGYIETRNMPKFTVVDTPGSWLPTPPKYMEALEPHWMKVRTFVLDSTSRFRKALPFVYSADSTSAFYKEVKKMYDIANSLSADQLAATKFWDDNPSPLNVQGHVVTTNRQNTPGGHWMGITRGVAKENHLTLPQTCEILSKVAIAIADAFKVVWDTKYVSNNIRPITYINKFIDPNWMPVLETPNFPEFSSGHSGISHAAAYILTQRFGEYAFIDSTNVPFGFPPRKFTSFSDAANESAMSRVFGGIHYKPSCDSAAEQGRSVGSYIMANVKTGNDFTFEQFSPPAQ